MRAPSFSIKAVTNYGRTPSPPSFPLAPLGMSTDDLIGFKDATTAAYSANSSSDELDVLKDLGADDHERTSLLPLDSRFTTKSGPRSLFVDGIRINVDPNVPALATNDSEMRWTWLDLFQPRKAVQDSNDIATRPSVYDDPLLAPHYAPMSV